MNNTIKILDDSSINIFCDASITTYNGVTYGCPGSIVVYKDEIIHKDSTILVESTNNESEIYAILLATRQAIMYKDHVSRINIFSDSRISVCGLRDWMVSWVKRSRDGVLMSTSGVVANQQIFLHIINLILNHLDEYHIYHIDGHCVSDKDITKAMKDFAKFNHKPIDIDEATYLCKYNNYVDNFSRYILEDASNINAKIKLSYLQRPNQGFKYHIPTESDISRIYSEIFYN